MQGAYWIANSETAWKNLFSHLEGVKKEDKYARVKVDAGKRTLPQNALKSVWYGDIARQRGDVTAKDVERECKYKYGLPILRRDPFRDFVFKAIDGFDNFKKYKTENYGELTGLEIKHLSMDSYAVTSIMSVKELSEYAGMMQSDYPYLRGRKDV